MAAPNLLLLLVGDPAPERLREAVDAWRPPPAHVHVLAPPLPRPLDWLASADDDARREAEIRALDAEWLLADETDVSGQSGDPDPIQAVEDAPQTFRADAILLGGLAAEPGLERDLCRFGLPVARIEPPPHHPPAPTGASARSPPAATPRRRSRSSSPSTGPCSSWPSSSPRSSRCWSGRSATSDESVLLRRPGRDDTDAPVGGPDEDRDMSHQMILAALVTCASGYGMLYAGLAKGMLRTRAGGRCPSCGRMRHSCSCR